jgi:flagellar hook assembly protein FlgD
MRFPVTVSWKVAANAERGFVLTDAMNGKLAGIQKLAGEGSMTVNAAVNQLVLKVTGAGALPKEFALGANYPNPFNPSTKFQIALPADAYVEVAVFDILGRKVATLVNDVVPAGYQTIEWNGVTDERAPAMTGVYFVRMVSGTFNKIQKIMLMK